MRRPSGGPDQPYAVLAVHLPEADVDSLGGGGGYVFSGEIGPEGKLAVPPVDQDSEPYPARPPDFGQRIEGGADRAPGEEYIVHQDDLPLSEVKADLPSSPN